MELGEGLVLEEVKDSERRRDGREVWGEIVASTRLNVIARPLLCVDAPNYSNDRSKPMPTTFNCGVVCGDGVLMLRVLLDVGTTKEMMVEISMRKWRRLV